MDSQCAANKLFVIVQTKHIKTIIPRLACFTKYSFRLSFDAQMCMTFVTLGVVFIAKGMMCSNLLFLIFFFYFLLYFLAVL